MYAFLDCLSESDLRDLTERICEKKIRGQIASASRPILYNVLFSVFGFDLLYERSMRRALLLSLPRRDLQTFYERTGKSAEGLKDFDVAHSIAARAWRRGASIVQQFSETFEVPAAFLPEGVRRAEALEAIEPYQPLHPLFDYQEQTVEEVSCLLEGDISASALMQLPTGAGKTRTAMEAVARFLNWRGRVGAP